MPKTVFKGGTPGGEQATIVTPDFLNKINNPNFDGKDEDGSYKLPDATDTVKGVTTRGTSAKVTAGIDNVSFLTSALLRFLLNQFGRWDTAAAYTVAEKPSYDDYIAGGDYYIPWSHNLDGVPAGMRNRNHRLSVIRAPNGGQDVTQIAALTAASGRDYWANIVQRARYNGVWGDWSHWHDAIDVSGIINGILPIERGGTGLSASPSLLVNLAATAAANVLQASPRPGVTGALPVANGGTGASSTWVAANNLFPQSEISSTLPEIGYVMAQSWSSSGRTGKMQKGVLREWLGLGDTTGVLQPEHGGTGTATGLSFGAAPKPVAGTGTALGVWRNMDIEEYDSYDPNTGDTIRARDYKLPSGGTWAYVYGGDAAQLTGVANGGAVVRTGNASLALAHVYFCWRIQ